MSDDIETLRNICNQVMDDEPRKQAITALERLAADRDRLQGRVATLQKALDDRYAADLKAAKAIFAETGRTSGFPSVKEVVAWHVTEVGRLEAERDDWKLRAQQFQRERAELFDRLNGTPCAEIRWQYDRDSLRAKLDRATGAAEPLCNFAWSAVQADCEEARVYLNKLVSDLRAVLSELSADAPAQQTFQERVHPWMMACFGPEISADKVERNHRFLEEALELVQACDCPREDAHQLVDYVYDRAVGEPHQEVGGVQVTLAALCLANALDMHKAGEDELARIWTKVDKIRAKQAAKPKGSPLPQHVAPAQQPQISDEAV